jgi:SAM-dependent methyltransferase
MPERPWQRGRARGAHRRMKGSLMSVFGAYSRYYNLLYRDKDYSGEAAYVRSLIQEQHPKARTVLDLGCGTGRHASLLARMGYELTGVDRSHEMLAVARAQPSAAEPGGDSPRPRVSPVFVQGDIRAVRLGKTFDVVISLFHVMSYQTKNEDLRAAFDTAREHLNPGGLFIFDCWYGPAVLSHRPEVRVRRLEDDEILVTRLAEPVLHPNENLVDVRYEIFVRDKLRDRVDELSETHTMRYLFAPEVRLLLDGANLQLLGLREFMTDQSPGFDTWNAVFVAAKEG